MNDRLKFRTYIPDLKFFKYWGWIDQNHYIGLCACGDTSMSELLEKYTEQCTGLKDKNGKLIYEGDILCSPSWWWGPCFVYLDIGECGPCRGDSVMSYILARNINEPLKEAVYNIWNGAEVEVIGNIYEDSHLITNSELLEGEEIKMSNSRFKFRAWDEVNKIMHYDFQFIKEWSTGGWIIFQSDKQKLDWNTNNEFTLNVYPNPYFAEQLKIQQATGLKDKDGNLIYEGDILGGIYENLYVHYCDNCKQFQLKANDDGCMACIGDIHWQEVVEDNNKLEVLGNIYETPELLEGEGNEI